MLRRLQRTFALSKFLRPLLRAPAFFQDTSWGFDAKLLRFGKQIFKKNTGKEGAFIQG